jgi:hypothetical protein
MQSGAQKQKHLRHASLQEILKIIFEKAYYGDVTKLL